MSAAEPAFTKITLEEPIVRGEETIPSIQLRKPGAGELRGGIAISALINGDVDAVLKVLPRITIPALTKPEVESLDPADLAACAGEIVGFFLTKKQKAEAGLEA